MGPAAAFIKGALSPGSRAFSRVGWASHLGLFLVAHLNLFSSDALLRRLPGAPHDLNLAILQLAQPGSCNSERVP